jgi:hypothetical protein
MHMCRSGWLDSLLMIVASFLLYLSTYTVLFMLALNITLTFLRPGHNALSLNFAVVDDTHVEVLRLVY